MILTRTTDPTSEPISMDELKIHLRLDSDVFLEEFDLLSSIITAGREYIEDFTRRALFTQTWDMHLDSFPADTKIKMPFGNLQSVSYVKYTDSDGDNTTLTEDTDYVVETNGDLCGFVKLPYSGSWPSATLGTSNPVHIRFVCGWPATSSIPSKIKVALKMICHDLYENRESQAFTSGYRAEYVENTTVQRLLSSMRLMDEIR